MEKEKREVKDMVKRKLLLFFLLIPLLTGCWDYREPETDGYVIVLGIDKGEKGLLKLTFDIANPQVGTTLAGNLGQNEPPNTEITMLVDNLFTMKELSTVVYPKRITFSHLTAIIVSEEIAKSKEFEEIMVNLHRDRSFRRNIYLFISKGEAEEFIKKAQPVTETRIHKYYQFITNLSRESGLSPASTVENYCYQVSNYYISEVISYVALKSEDELAKSSFNNKADNLTYKGGDPGVILGGAVFHHGKMVGTISGEEVKIRELLQKRSESANFQHVMKDIKTKDKSISFSVTKLQRKLKVETLNPRPKLEIELVVDININLLANNTDYIFNNRNNRALRKEIEKELEKKSNELIKEAQSKYGDLFFFGIELRPGFLTIHDWEKYNWEEKFKHAEIKVNYKIKELTFGKYLVPLSEKEKYE